MNPKVLVLVPLSDATLSDLKSRYDVIYEPNARGRPDLANKPAAEIVAVVSNGSTGCSADLIQHLPNLKVIASFGAGYENIDVESAASRGIQVSNAPGANATTVADHAIALALAIARDLCNRAASVRQGDWQDVRSARPTLADSTVGIIGMGKIGKLVAQRVLGFSASVGYFDLAPDPSQAGRFYATAVELAQQSDFLIATCPGGLATHHLVNREVLTALGKDGFMVNVSRGTVVNSADLAYALSNGLIAGAGIDVFEEEPNIPQALLDAPNLVITPHMAGRSPTSVKVQTSMMLANLQEAIAGYACSNLVPGYERAVSA